MMRKPTEQRHHRRHRVQGGGGDLVLARVGDRRRVALQQQRVAEVVHVGVEGRARGGVGRDAARSVCIAP